MAKPTEAQQQSLIWKLRLLREFSEPLVIVDILCEEIEEIIGDPDQGQELTDEVKERLRHCLSQAARLPRKASDVAGNLGLSVDPAKLEEGRALLQKIRDNRLGSRKPKPLSPINRHRARIDDDPDKDSRRRYLRVRYQGAHFRMLSR